MLQLPRWWRERSEEKRAALPVGNGLWSAVGLVNTEEKEGERKIWSLLTVLVRHCLVWFTSYTQTPSLNKMVGKSTFKLDYFSSIDLLGLSHVVSIGGSSIGGQLARSIRGGRSQSRGFRVRYFPRCGWLWYCEYCFLLGSLSLWALSLSGKIFTVCMSV